MGGCLRCGSDRPLRVRLSKKRAASKHHLLIPRARARTPRSMLPASGAETVWEGDHSLSGGFGRQEPAHAPALDVQLHFRPGRQSRETIGPRVERLLRKPRAHQVQRARSAHRARRSSRPCGPRRRVCRCPATRALAAGWSASAGRRLVRSNRVRTALWTARAVIALALLV